MPDDLDYQPGADDPLNSTQWAVQTSASNGALPVQRIHCPSMKLLITLAQAHGEDMVLSTIQLLRVALVTRLLLLLLAPLMIITTLVALIAMSALITVKS